MAFFGADESWKDFCATVDQKSLKGKPEEEKSAVKVIEKEDEDEPLEL
jgi:hypothetical protein